MNLAQTWITQSVKINEAGCWEWMGNRTPAGYGKLGSFRAHRASYEAFKGPLLPGQVVMHICDNPPCVNPAHLKAGTQKENMDDMRNKGRSNYLAGAKHPRAKLTEADVRMIRKDGRPHKQIAEQFGVSRKAIEKIVYGERWKHISEEVNE